MQDTRISETKQAISTLVLKEPGVCAVGTGTDGQGRATVIIHVDPSIPNTRERVAKLIEPFADQVPIQYVESGPYRKFPAT